jgi:hypothetical protein
MAEKKDAPAAEVTQEPAAPGTVEQQDVEGAEFVNKPGDSPVAGGRADGAILTAEPPAEADKSSYAGPGDAEAEQPPVRTTRPDVPIAVSMATGAGQHVPPDPEKYDEAGRAKD